MKYGLYEQKRDINYWLEVELYFSDSIHTFNILFD